MPWPGRCCPLPEVMAITSGGRYYRGIVPIVPGHCDSAGRQGVQKMAEEIDLATWEPALTADPYPFLRRLREEPPVCKVVIDGLPPGLVTRKHDARDALTHPRL